MKYIFLPFIAWVTSGCVKFAINLFRFGMKDAKKLIGYGGFPSTHTTIISSVVFFIGFEKGFMTSNFSLGLGILLIIIIDAHGLRREVEKHSITLNQLQNKTHLREKMGHTWPEIFGGLLVGLVLSYLAFYI